MPCPALSPGNRSLSVAAWVVKKQRGRGVVYVTLEALRHLKLSLENTTVAIQGFGNVGSHTARIMHQEGARVIAVSDVHGGIYNERGLGHCASSPP